MIQVLVVRVKLLMTMVMIVVTEVTILQVIIVTLRACKFLLRLQGLKPELVRPAFLHEFSAHFTLLLQFLHYLFLALFRQI